MKLHSFFLCLLLVVIPVAVSAIDWRLFHGRAINFPGRGAFPPASCNFGEIFIDTDETIDTNCTTTNDNSLCLCIATDTWTAHENLGAGGASEWTDSGTVVYPTETTDDVSIGSATLLNSSKLSIDGDADQVQLTVQGNGTQTDSIVIIEDSAGTEAFAFDGDGTLTLTSGGAIEVPGNDTAGQRMELKEDTDNGAHEWAIDLGSVNLDGSATNTQTPNADGKFPIGTHVEATYTDCNVLYAPSAEVQATDDVQSVFRAPQALTITEVWCETDTGTVNLDVQIDDGTPADVMGADLVCASTAVSDSTGLTGAMADGDTLDWAITSVATNPTRLTVCTEYTID